MILEESFYSLITRFFMAGSRAALLIIIANLLGPDAQGSFGIALSVVTLAALFGSAGLEISTTYYAGQYPEKIGSLLSHVIMFGLVSGVLISALTYGIIELFPGYFAHFPATFLWAIPISVLGEILLLYMGSILIGSRDFKSYFWVVIFRFGTILLIVLSVSILDILDVSLLMPVWGLGVWLGVLISFLCTRALVRNRSSKLVFDWKLLYDQLIYGKNAYVNNLTNWLNNKVDLFILAAFLDVTLVGYYSMSITVAEGLLYLPKGLGAVAIARESSIGRGSKVHTLYKMNTVLIGIIGIVLFASAPWIIPLIMSDAFRPAVPSFRIILPGIFALSIAIIASNHLFGMGKSKIPSRGAFINLLITVLLDLLLIPRFGLIGAATAASAGYIAYAIYLMRAISRYSEIKVFQLLVPTLVDYDHLKIFVMAYLNKKKRV